MEKQLVTMEEASQILSLGKTKLYEYIKSNELQSLKLGKSRRIVHSSIEAFIDRRIVGDL
jgi:excisionase family DNA binding protein